ncbi:MAG: hypothetical protein IKL24_00890 [Clostridia bacterium]|nr:hypothetical protein [Clostridia bacterium]
MKRIISLLLVLCMCLAVFAGCAKKNDEKAPDGMKKASGNNVDYSMYVPTAWEVDRNDLFTSAYYPGRTDKTNISATAHAIAGDIATVEDWWKTFENDLSNICTEMSKVAVTKARLGGVDGKEFTFTGKNGGTEYNFIITAVIKDFYVYYLTYTSPTEYNEKHLEERTMIVEAFRFDK